MQRHCFRVQPHALLVQNQLQTCQITSYLQLNYLLTSPEYLSNHNIAVKPPYLSTGSFVTCAKVSTCTSEELKKNPKKHHIGRIRVNPDTEAQKQKFGKQA